MSYITRAGNLAETPTLRQGERGSYCYAAVIVNDRIRQKDGEYVDGPAVRYEVAVNNSNEAERLVETAEADGNIRVVFGGDYYVTEFAGEKGTFLRHKVNADFIAASFRGQHISVRRNGA